MQPQHLFQFQLQLILLLLVVVEMVVSSLPAAPADQKVQTHILDHHPHQQE
jgi:hypothetical protein